MRYPKISILTLLVLLSAAVSAQAPQHTGQTWITQVPYRARVDSTFGLPIANDTTLNGGLDSLFSLVGVRATGKYGIWFRDSAAPGVHKFTRMLTTRDTAPPAGLNTYVQFNDAGKMGAVSGMSFNKSTNSLSLTGDGTAANFQASANLTAGSTGTISFTGRTKISSPSDGTLKFTNNAGTGFTNLNLGPSTSSFPRLGANGAIAEFKLGDGSDWTFVKGKTASLGDSSHTLATTEFVLQNRGSGGGGGGSNNFLLPLTTSGSNVGVRVAAADGSTTGAASFTASDFNTDGSGNVSLDYTNMQELSGSVKGLPTPTMYNNWQQKVDPTRSFLTTSPLTGGGDFSANRTLGIGGLSGIGTGNYIVGVNSAGTGWEYKQLIQGSGVTITHGANSMTIAATGTGGIGSVGLAAPTGFSVDGPLTSDGTLHITTTLNGILYGNGSNTIAPATISAPLSFSAGTLSMPVATNSQNGYLSAADHTAYSGYATSKQDLITGGISSGISANYTINRVMGSDASGKLYATGTNTTTLGYLDINTSLTTLLAGKEPTINYTFQTFTDGATITLNLNNGRNINWKGVLGGNRTLALTNIGQGTYTIIVRQDITGGRTLTVPVGAKIAQGKGSSGTLLLSPDPNAVDKVIITYDGTDILFSLDNNFQ